MTSNVVNFLNSFGVNLVSHIFLYSFQEVLLHLMSNHTFVIISLIKIFSYPMLQI